MSSENCNFGLFHDILSPDLGQQGWRGCERGHFPFPISVTLGRGGIEMCVILYEKDRSLRFCRKDKIRNINELDSNVSMKMDI
ncbi:hypothetical protein HOLleu_32317 [Holothuria leucospilota]|uniref:Uncharacterized protein n=1 Tax=Holothuria leucospilota TaxID=206669 RepID=A0A9Q0YRH7_HOLLE|nr:hypothetical protein HOLleu_32317 [Holothuria leucospilota]